MLVTGGVRGIGRAIAEAFLSAGAQVLTCARHEPEQIPRAGDRTAQFVAGDVRDPEAAAMVVTAAAERFGRLDVVVNNAGGSPLVDAATASPRVSTRIVELNLLAPLHISQAANSVMQQQDDGGSIIMISSVSGARPSPGTAAYGAAKAGLNHLVSSLAIEWGPKVRLNSLIVGLVATEQAESHYGGAEGIAEIAKTIPAHRMGTPQDVAHACLMLGSPLAGFISGGAMAVHGGGESPSFLAVVSQLNGGATDPITGIPVS